MIPDLPGPPHQDWIELAGEKSPGVAVVRGAGNPRNWDVRQGYGLTGATVIFTGVGLAKFEVDIFCWRNSHFEDWKKFAKKVLMAPASDAATAANAGKKSLSMAITHPALNDPPLSIKQVVVEDVTQWEQSPDAGGLWSRTIKFLEYRQPKPALVKPFEGPPGSPLAVKPPVDPKVMQIQANKAQIAKLAAGFTP